MEPRWIATTEELAELASSLSGVAAIALDSESDSLHRYREKVCLVQIAAAGSPPALVDPLAVPDLSALGPILRSEAVEKVLHGAPYDVGALKRDFGFGWARIFDTQIAAQFLGCGEAGLSALLERELAVKHRKGAQTSDWSRRPLTAEQRSYAAADVEHLVELRDRLVEKLRTAGREAWAREESDALADTPAWSRAKDPLDPFRIRGWRSLDAEGAAVLAELLLLRDTLAREADRPHFRIVDDAILVEFARARPVRGRPVGGLSRPAQAAVARMGAGLFDAIERGRGRRLERLSGAPAPAGRRPSAAENARIERLLARRAEAAPRLGLEPGFLLPRRLVEAIAKEAPRDEAALAGVEGLRRWRIEAMGAEILAAVG